MKKVLSIMLSVILIATMFVGCGNSSSKELTLANYVEKEDRIFLLVRGFDYDVPTKDSNISKILVLKSDGTCIFSDTKKTLGELEQMEDSEIKELVEQSYNENIKNAYDYLTEIMSKQNVLNNDWKNKADDYINNPVSNYKIVINSDGSGNNTASETLVLQDIARSDANSRYVQDTFSIKLSEVYLFGAFAEMQEDGFQIYDSTYFGYQAKYEGIESYLITRGKNLKQFSLDPLGTKNTTTDNVKEVKEQLRNVIFEFDSYIKTEN